MSLRLQRMFFFTQAAFFTALVILVVPVSFGESRITHGDNIGNTFLELNYASAQNRAGESSDIPSDAEAQANTEKALETFCSWRNPGTWFTGCLAEKALNISSRFLIFSAGIFDAFLFFTLDNTILKADFVNDTWTDMKDLANLAFILGLIYMGFALIIGRGDSSKKLFVKLIIVALVLNFSLFISRVIIDAGNITALTFYNAIDAQPAKDSYVPTDGVFAPKDGEKMQSISGAIIQAFNPARIIDQNMFQKIISDSQSGGLGEQAVERGGVYSLIFLIFAVLTVMNVMGGWEIIKASFTFVSRTIWLIILSIVSPLAFVALFLPNGKKHFDKWLKYMIDKCFCIVVYLFFIWLLIIMLNGSSSLLGDDAPVASFNSWQQIMITVIIQFFIVISLLKIAGSTAKKMCEGEISVGSWVGTRATGLAVGLATGGAGMAMRGTLGRVAFNAREGRGRIGSALKDAEANGSSLAMFTRRRLQNVANLKFGTTDGYQGKLTSEANSRMSDANEVENLKTAQVSKNLQKDYLNRRLSTVKANNPDQFNNKEAEDAFLKDEEIRYKASKQYEDDQKEAKKIGQQTGTDMLKKFTKGGGAGILKRSFAFATTNATPATEEALDRRTKQFEAGEEEKRKQEILKERNADKAFEAAIAKSATKKEAERLVAEVQKKSSSQASATPGEIISSQDVQNSITELATNAADRAHNLKLERDEEGNVVSGAAEKLTKEQQDKITEMRGRFERELAEGLEKSSKEQAEIKTELDKTKEELKENTDALISSKEQQELLKQIAKEISDKSKRNDLSENEKFVRIDSARREALVSAGIRVVGDGVDFDQLTEISTAGIKLGTKVTELNNQVNSTSKEISKYERQLSEIDKLQRKDLSEGLRNVTKTVDARIDSQLRTGDALTTATAERLTEERGAREQALGSDKASSRDARATDVDV